MGLHCTGIVTDHAVSLSLQVVIVGTKYEAAESGGVDLELVNSFGCASMQVSAKTGHNVTEVFQKITRMVRAQEESAKSIGELFKHDREPVVVCYQLFRFCPVIAD